MTYYSPLDYMGNMSWTIHCLKNAFCFFLVLKENFSPEIRKGWSCSQFEQKMPYWFAPSIQLLLFPQISSLLNKTNKASVAVIQILGVPPISSPAESHKEGALDFSWTIQSELCSNTCVTLQATVQSLCPGSSLQSTCLEQNLIAELISSSQYKTELRAGSCDFNHVLSGNYLLNVSIQPNLSHFSEVSAVRIQIQEIYSK